MPLSSLDISVPLGNFAIKPEPECTAESTKTIGVTVYDCSKYECRPLQTGRHLILQHGKKKKKLCLTVSSAAPSMQQFWFWNHYVLKHISPKFKIGFSSSPFSYTSVTQTDLTQSLSTSLKIKSLSSIIFAHTVYFRGNWYLQNTHTHQDVRVNIQSLLLSLPRNAEWILTVYEVWRTTNPNNNSTLSIMMQHVSK